MPLTTRIAARAAVITSRVSPGPLAVHVVTAMRQAVADGTWPCDREEPPYLAPSYRWVLVLEALQAARRDGQDGRHPRSAEWEQAYGRGIPGPDGASQPSPPSPAGTPPAQRDPAQLHAVAWAGGPAPRWSVPPGRGRRPRLDRTGGLSPGRLRPAVPLAARLPHVTRPRSSPRSRSAPEVRSRQL